MKGESITEVFDTFFNGRPAPRTNELERLRTENTELKAMIRKFHANIPGCNCWVCQPPKAKQP